MSEFAVGEVAVLCGIKHPRDIDLNGVEVTIVSELDYYGYWLSYRIDSPQLRNLRPGCRDIYAEPRLLRKLRPPPDWDALATGKPVREEA